MATLLVESPLGTQPHDLSFDFLLISHVYVRFPAFHLWGGLPFI